MVPHATATRQEHRIVDKAGEAARKGGEAVASWLGWVKEKAADLSARDPPAS